MGYQWQLQSLFNGLVAAPPFLVKRNCPLYLSMRIVDGYQMQEWEGQTLLTMVW